MIVFHTVNHVSTPHDGSNPRGLSIRKNPKYRTVTGNPCEVLRLKTHQQWHRSSPMLNFTQNYFVITSFYYIGMSVKKKDCGKYHIPGEIYVWSTSGLIAPVPTVATANSVLHCFVKRPGRQ